MQSIRLLLATRNRHKAAELSALLRGAPIELLTLEQYPRLPEVAEDAPNLEGNAAKKARAAAKGAGLWALGDDTGLEVPALGGAPGAYSARYAGPGATYADNCAKLLEAMRGIADRRAAFRTVLALCSPDGTLAVEEGRLDGRIALSPRGSNGFGYDPLFELPGRGRTLAELSAREKNAVSHRSEALRRMLPRLRRLAGAALCAAALALAAADPALAGRTEPVPETLWERIMRAQAVRGLREGAQLLEQRDYESAVREFEKAVAANPNDATGHMMLGAGYYWLGEVDRSLECYQKALALEPSSGQAYMLRGISLAWKNRVREAYEDFKKAAELEPQRADVQMNLGSVSDSLNMTQEALKHFRQATLLAPDEPLYHFQLGMFYRKLGRDQDSSDSLRKALRLHPHFEDALLELGAVDERLGEKKAAAHSFKKAVDLKSKDAVARFRLARLYLLLGQAEKARAILADAFHLTPEGGGHGLKLSVAYAGGKKKEEPQAGEGQQPAPPPADPLDVFARNLERIPVDQSALLQVDVVFVPRPKLVRVAPESPSSLKRALEKAVAEPADVGAPKAARREYAIRGGRQDQRDEQIARILGDLREVLKGAPEGADVRLGMNLNYARPSELNSVGRGSDSEAKVSYQPRQVGNDMGLWIIGTGWMSLVEEVLPEPGDAPAHPDQSDWWVSTGLGYATLGESQRALAAFERAVALDGKNPAAWLGEGIARVMAGQEPAAVAALQQALSIAPKNRAAKEGLKWLLRPPAKKK